MLQPIFKGLTVCFLLLTSCTNPHARPIADGGEDAFDARIPDSSVVDEDGDGYPSSEDCDDDDPSIHPGAPETCDGRDNDCDGAIDGEDSTDALTCYHDGDGDGFGNELDTQRGCECPTGFVEVGGDCDDDNAEVFPGPAGELVLERDRIELFFVGQDEPEVVGLTLSGGSGCVDIAASADVPWLDPVLDIPGGRLIVFIRPSEALGGVHEGRVFLSESVSDEPLGALVVELRSLGAVRDGLERRVLVVGADGVRGDSIEPSETPWLDALRQHAAWSHRASTQLDAATNSGPGWTSILTGVDADKHGITSNSGWGGQNPDFPTFLWRANHQLGVSVAAACLWEPIIGEILEPEAADVTEIADDASIAERMAGWLAGGEHVVHFVAFDGPDHAGHAEGFDPAELEYREAIGVVDTYLGRFIDAILNRPAIEEEQWMIVYVSDHGGERSGHGCREPACRDIPLYFAGPGLFPAIPSGFVSHMDVAPTVLSYLGLEIDPAWELDGSVRAVPFESSCDNAVDDDGDGAVDCEDSDCSALFACTCPEEDLGSSLGSTIASGSTTGQGDELAGSCGGEGSPDVTFSWVAPAEDRYTFDLTGSDRNFDTVLYVLDEGCLGTEMACNDDASDVQSAAQVDLVAGQRVTVVVDGVRGNHGGFELNVEPLSSCPDGTLGSVLGEGAARGSNEGQGATFFASCARSGRDVTYTWTAPDDGEYVFDTRGSDYDTVLHVRDGDCSGEELACSDDDAPNYASELEVELRAGQTVTLVISGFNGRPEGPGSLPAGGEGNFVLNIRSR